MATGYVRRKRVNGIAMALCVSATALGLAWLAWRRRGAVLLGPRISA